MIAKVIHRSVEMLTRTADVWVKPVLAAILGGGMLLAPPNAHAAEIKTDEVTVDAEILVGGLNHPWGLDFLPDGEALVTERDGRLLLVTADRKLIEVEGLPTIAIGGQAGLLDVAAAPDFARSKMIYFSYSDYSDEGSGTAVARAKLARDGQKARLDGLQVVFAMSKKTNAGVHFGSRLVFHPDGTLFVTMGDRGDRDRAQDFGDHAGAVIRINRDGSVPSDNPYLGQEGVLPELWSKGHRNPQGAVFDPVSQSVWVVEHGARGGDELNRPEAGKNYGWPVISYGRHYSGFKIGVGTEAPGYEQPVWYWDPSIAPSGLAVYDGEMFPEWKGDFLVGALKFRLLVRLDRKQDNTIGKEERMFAKRFGRIRDVNIAPDGSIWLLTDESDGAIVRISRAR